MNWRLIVLLSGFGLAMAVATVYVIPSNLEPIFWLLIFAYCAYEIGGRAPGRPFLHGVALGLVNSVWITSIHVLLFDAYVAHHADELNAMSAMPLAAHPRVLMAIVGPIVGLVSGVVIGLFALMAARLRRARPSRMPQA